ncbi:MAG: SRPBCC domain-containing protein [Chloroflexota bacterium]
MTSAIPNQAIFVDKHTILFHRHLHVDQSRLWSAISTKHELDQWFMPTELDLRNDGNYSFEGGWDGWISDLNPPHHLQFNSSPTSFTRFEIEVRSEGVLLSLIDRLQVDVTPPKATEEDEDGIMYNQPGGPGTHWTGVIAGWHCFVDALEDYLAGQEGEDLYDQRCMAYNNFLEEYHRR